MCPLLYLQVFITRQSSQPGTLALSVKLTPAVEAGNRHSIGAAVIGAGVQHYLIEAAESPQHGVRLESSDFVFDNLPALLAHYCQCCDELPVRLKLPAKIRQCPNRPSLTTMALLGNSIHSKEITKILLENPPLSGRICWANKLGKHMLRLALIS